MIDPIGLSLENFDVTGAWRIKDNGSPVDAASTFYDGTPLAGPDDLRRALLKRSPVADPHVHRKPDDLRAGPTARPRRYADGAAASFATRMPPAIACPLSSSAS